MMFQVVVVLSSFQHHEFFSKMTTMLNYVTDSEHLQHRVMIVCSISCAVIRKF